MTQTTPTTPIGRPRRDRAILAVAICATLLVTAAVAVAAYPGSSPAASDPAPAAADPNTAAASGAPDATAAPGASARPDASGVPDHPGRPGHGFFPGPWGDRGRGDPGGPGGSFGGGLPFGVRGGISITAIDGTQLSLQTDDGWTRTIDTAGATISKGGQEVKVKDLAVGDTILFREQRNDDGTYSVTAIYVLQPHVAGTVSELAGDTFTVTEPDGTTRTVRVDDTTTYTLGRTEADKTALANGVQVDVEGSASGDTFQATAVHVLPARVWGTVKATNADSISVVQRDGRTATIHVDADTTYHARGNDSASLADVAADDVVIAQGTSRADGSLDATDVVILGAPGDWQHGPFGRPLPGTPGWPVEPPKEPNASPSPGQNG